MLYTINAPQQACIKGTIQLPSSKSICNRALIINALAYSSYDIENLSNCDDTRAVINVLNSDGNSFDIGAAGTAMRFLTAFLSKIVGKWTITGSERMKQRPIKILVDALNTLGAHIEYAEKEGYPPLHITGSALQGGSIRLDGSVSSQYISALLMVSPLMEKGLSITLSGHIASEPYIQMTLKIMEDFGVKATWHDKTITVPPQVYKPIPFVVESDWSAASYWYEIMALKGEGSILLKGLRQDSYQGDANIAVLFEQLGVLSSFEPEGVRLTATNEAVPSFTYNFAEQPDLTQTFVVTCCLLGVPFFFGGLETLKIKETDRIAALIAEMKKLGYVLHEKKGEGTLEWDGMRTAPETTPEIAVYEDHRMAMAFAPAAIKINNLGIKDPQVVSKSYPAFWQDLQSVGFEMREIKKTTDRH